MEYAQHYDDKLKHNLKLLKMYFNLATIKHYNLIFLFALILFTLYYISIIRNMLIYAKSIHNINNLLLFYLFND
jgi:hypothetical protein